MKNNRLLRQIIRGAIAEHEFARRRMDKLTRNMALSADALTELGNATYESSRAIVEFSKVLKDQQ